MNHNNNNMEKSKSFHFWTTEETEFMLSQLKDLNILKYIDGRKTRNGKLFKQVAELMDDAGFKRTSEQVRVRWKHLKQTYYNASKNNQANGPYCEIMKELLGRRALSESVDHVSVLGMWDLDDTAEVEAEAEEESPKTEQEPIEDEDSSGLSEKIPSPHTQTSSSAHIHMATSIPNPGLTGPRMTPTGRKKRRRHESDVELLLDRMQQMQNAWMEQIQQSQEREERLVNSILQSNATVVSALMEGIRSLQSSMPPNPSQAQQQQQQQQQQQHPEIKVEDDGQ